MQQSLTTKQQRLNWYKKALQWIQDNPEETTVQPVCLVLKWYLASEVKDYMALRYRYRDSGQTDLHESKDLLPELWDKRTYEEATSTTGWFEYTNDRVEALESIIEQMERELLEGHERELEQHFNKGLLIMGVFVIVVITAMVYTFIHLK